MQNPYESQLASLAAEIAQTKQLLADPEFSALAELELKALESQLTTIQEAAAEYAQSLEETVVAGAVKVNCTIEIRQGAGGDEAKIWAQDLLRMYLRLAERLSLKVEVVDDLVVKFKGRANLLNPKTNQEETLTVYQLLENESGVHRVQRVPATEAQGRIHTSTASVAVLPEVAASEVTIREEELEWSFMRAGGAGGQSVNKTSSAVRLVHTPSGIVVNARQERKQAQNRQIALELLRSQLWEIEEEKRQLEIGNARSAIGRARRAEKIRTYNYPQNRITDHRTKQSWHNLPVMLDGAIETMLLELRTAILEGTTLSTDPDAED
jgi:peptide chain release factor 1